jgi:glycosyltransferase involved in cell wall biosynthesis
LGYVLIVDRHSNFKLASINSRKPKWFFFHLLSRYTVKKADFTIITNENLKKLVEDWGGKGLVLQDRLPNLDPNTILAKLPGDINIMCVTTYSSDEPIFEIAEAASSLLDVNFYFTGRYSSYRHIKEFEAIKPSNVTLTGFISEAEYIALMRGVDYVMVLTTEDDLLTCGAYEAVAEEKPMILSNTKAIIEYFNKGAIYTGPETYELKQAVEAACRMKDNLTNDVKLLKSELTSSWAETFEQLVQKITSSDRNNDHTGS